MFCHNCGMRYDDGRKFCTRCGVPLIGNGAACTSAHAYPQQQPQPYSPYTQPGAALPRSVETDRTLRLIAFIFNIVSCVIIGMAGFVAFPFFFILAWAVPMTVHSWGIYQGEKDNTMAFGVCDLIFVNVVSGVLLLISRKDA